MPPFGKKAPQSSDAESHSNSNSRPKILLGGVRGQKSTSGALSNEQSTHSSASQPHVATPQSEAGIQRFGVDVDPVASTDEA
jgi:hypothetical protein